MTSISLPVIDETDAAVETLKFLSDGNRLRILRILSQRESCVCELIDQIGLTQPLVSYHLRRLRDAGLVRTRRKAQWVYYSIEPEAWRSLIAPLAQPLSRHRVSAGSRLRRERQLRHEDPQPRPRRQRAERDGLARGLTRSVRSGLFADDLSRAARAGSSRVCPRCHGIQSLNIDAWAYMHQDACTRRIDKRRSSSPTASCRLPH